MRLPRVAELFDTDRTTARELFLSFEYAHEILGGLGAWLEGFLRTHENVYRKRSTGLYVAEGARVHPDVISEGLCLIEEGATVRHGTYLRGPLLVGRGAVIGGCSEIKGCILLDGATLAHFNYAGDSIFGRGSHMGSHAVASNLRADGKSVHIKTDEGAIDTGRRKLGAMVGDGAEIGCGAVLCPGTHIGKGTIVYPLSRVRGMIESMQIYKGEGNISKREV